MRTGDKTGKLLDILNKLPVLLLIPFIFAVLAIALIKRAEYCGYKYKDNPVWTGQNTLLLLATVFVFLVVFLLVYRLAGYLERFGRRRLVWIIIYLTMVIQVLYILYLPAKQFADQNSVNQIALDLLKGKYTAFQKKGYLYQYPNNIGITLMLSFLYKFFPNTMLVPKLLNVIFSCGTTYLIFRIFEETCATKDRKGYGILFFAGFFPPVIMLNNLVYNDIVATTIFTGVVFEAIRYVKTKKWHHLIIAGFYTVTGNFLRQVGIVILIAVTIYFILKRVNIIKALAFLVSVFILCGLPMTLVNYYLLYNAKITEPMGLNSIPVHMWINMGMNEKKFGYWDGSQSLNIYLRQGERNKAKSTELYLSLMKQNIEENGVLRIARVYAKKDAWLWTEGTYQAEYYGIGSWGYLYPTPATKFVEHNIVLRNYVRRALHSINFVLMALTAVGLVHSLAKKYQYPLMLPLIVLLGFIGFYTIWEIKPRYIYITYPYLIMMAYYGLGVVSNGLSMLKRKLFKPSDAVKTFGAQINDS